MTEAPGVATSRRRFGFASIVLGVLSLAVVLIEPGLAFILALLGLYFGLVARDGSSRKVAIIGVALNVAALLLFAMIAANLFP